MKYFTPYKIAVYLLLLFFAGHTFGGMLAQTSLGPASDQVFEAMKVVHFDFRGADSTWYGFWFGFGLMVSAYLLFSAFLLWHLDSIPPASFTFATPIAWAIVVTQFSTAVLGYLYFFAGPTTFACLITALVTWGTLRKAKSVAPSGQVATAR